MGDSITLGGCRVTQRPECPSPVIIVTLPVSGSHFNWCFDSPGGRNEIQMCVGVLNLVGT